MGRLSPSHSLRGIGRFIFGRILPRWAYPVLKGPLKGTRFLLGSLSGTGAGGSVYFNLVEPEQTQAFAAELAPRMTFFDVGANVGYYALLASKIIGPAGNVVAFEPLARNIAYLHRHAELNRADNIQILPYAVSEHSGSAWFAAGNDSAMGKITATGGDLLVPTITLDEASALLRLVPDIIKIDVEGAEVDVLHGSKELLAAAAPIIFLSTHSPELRGRCFEFLTSAGYTVEPLVRTEDPHEFIARPAKPRNN